MTTCLEQKHLLSGDVHTYVCELVHYEPGFGVLKYVIDREYDIAGHRLLSGDVTLALYWENRPYTLYLWNLRRGGRLHYFNIADRVSLSPELFSWRDLVIDVLVDPSGMAQVLDSHELPSDLDRDLQRHIQDAQKLILAYRQTITSQAADILRRLRL